MYLDKLYPRVLSTDVFIVNCQVTQFLESQGFLDYLERCINSEENSNNLLDKLQDATGRGQNPLTIFPSQFSELEIITIAEPYGGVAGCFSVSLKIAFDCFSCIILFSWD